MDSNGDNMDTNIDMTTYQVVNAPQPDHIKPNKDIQQTEPATVPVRRGINVHIQIGLETLRAICTIL